MKTISNYKHLVGWLTISAGIAAAASLYFAAVAVDYHLEVFSDPLQVLQYAHNANTAYWFIILDMAGYYLLLLPAIFYLYNQYKFHSPWVSLFTFCGLGYVLTGAIGTAILAAAWPYLMDQYKIVASDQQFVLQELFNTITLIVTKGLWNILEVLFAGVWWIGFGKLLLKDHKVSGILAIIAGIACLLDSIGTIADWKLVAELGVNIYLLMGIVWPVVLGIQLVRKSREISESHSSISSSSNLKSSTHVEG